MDKIRRNFRIIFYTVFKKRFLILLEELLESDSVVLSQLGYVSNKFLNRLVISWFLFSSKKYISRRKATVLVLFTAIVTKIDDFIDTNIIAKDETLATFKKKILSIVCNNYSMSYLLEYMNNLVNRSRSFSSYFDNAILAEYKLDKGNSRYFSWDEVLDYRAKTTIDIVDVFSSLFKINKGDLLKLKSGAWFFQYLDDFLDEKEDSSYHTPNIFSAFKDSHMGNDFDYIKKTFSLIQGYSFSTSFLLGCLMFGTALLKKFR